LRPLGPEPPRMQTIAERGRVGDRSAGADAGVARPLVFGMRGARGAVDVGSRAGAGIDELAPFQVREGGLVYREPIRLHDRPFVPVEPEPAEVVEDLLGRLRLHARRVDVFDAEEQLRVLFPSGEPGEEIGASIAEMLLAGRRWGETGDGPAVR